MAESRITLLSSLACLLLVAWLVLRPAAATVAEIQPAVIAPPGQESQVAESLRELAARIESLRAQVASLGLQREAAPATAAVAEAAEPLVHLQRELQDLRLAVQALGEAQAEGGAGAMSHNLRDLRREFPTTNWEACENLLQRAFAVPDAGERESLDSDRSAVLAELCMQRPRDVLLLLGAPTRTYIVNGRFEWRYESPKATEDGDPARWVRVLFEKGYVWHLQVYRSVD